MLLTEQVISSNAQWFEDHSPIDDAFKKRVTGVSAKVITAAILARRPLSFDSNRHQFAKC